VVRVINGQVAPDQRYTFAQVSLMLDVPNDESTYDHQCGGSLVASDMILTAAHCRQWFSEINVDRYDFADRTDLFETYHAADVMVHPRYDSDTYRHDFMLIQIDRPFKMDTRPIRLNNRSQIPEEGTDLTVLGWGTTDHSDPLNLLFPSVLQRGALKYISNEQCSSTTVNNKALYDGEVFSEMMCASSSVGVDACSGDSGGPLIIEGEKEGLDVLVGLVSWGRGCAIYPGVYSRISSGFDWIRKQICYAAVDPPRYLECTEDERNPKYSLAPFMTPSTPIPVSTLVNPPTPIPVLRTTLPPQATSEAPVLSSNFINPLIPVSGTPVTIQPMSERLVMTTILIEIQLDADSEETGWYVLSEQGEKLYDRPAGTYRDRPTELVWEVVQLPVNETYFFVITDAEGNGMCCTDGHSGWFRLSIKQIFSDPTFDKKDKVIPIVIGTGEFGSSARRSFQTDLRLIERSVTDDEVNARNPDYDGGSQTDDWDSNPVEDEVQQGQSSAQNLLRILHLPAIFLILQLLNTLL
jgi:trypsin